MLTGSASRTARATLLAAGALAAGLGAGSLLPLQAREEAPAGPRRAGPVSYADVLEPALEAVVHVEGRRGARSRRRDSLLPWFFRGGEDAPESESQGSGVVVREDGLILTNSHVVDGADRVIVKLADRRELVAKVVGADPASDIAVLKIEAGRMARIPFGRSAELRIGDVVFALGSPLGLDQTATMGIVSAKGRDDLGITLFDSLIQTDAAINPGNSGGAMINAAGELVGINTAILYRGTPSFQGVGLAIPIDVVRNVMDQLLDQGRVVRAFLGVSLEDMDASRARRFGLERPAGAIVTVVHEGTPAAAAGLHPGDVILGVDGAEVGTLGALRLAISSRRPGERIRLSVLRDGDAKTLTARLTTMEDPDAAIPSPAPPAAPEPEELWGLRLQGIDRGLRERLGFDEEMRGVLLAGVAPGSPAERAGLEAGDVLVRIERRRADTVEEARQLIRGAEDGALLLLVRSGELTRFVVLEE